jgi:hypothetical protein
MFVQRLRRRTVRAVVGTGVVLGGLEATTHLPSQGRASDVYHYLSDQWATPLMRTFLDPESTYVECGRSCPRNLRPSHVV